jgi:futalosine hydrolase
MDILIVSATTVEIKPLLSLLQEEKRVDANLSSYSYREMNIDVLITGLGMVQTAYHMGRAFARKEYRGAMNFGIAGSYHSEYPPGKVVHIIRDQFPELGSNSGEYFLSLIDLKLLEEDTFPFRNGEMVNSLPIASRTLRNLKQARAITVNRAHSTNHSIEKIRQRCDPQVESMEGAAFIFSCMQEGIPCAQVRSVSNFVEERNPHKWNIALAIENLNKVIVALLNE